MFAKKLVCFKCRKPYPINFDIVKCIECGSSSTGNMGASVSAYSARAGMKSKIIIPFFAPKQKLKQIKAYNADVMVIKGSYDDALKISMNLKQKNKKSFLAGDFPFRLEGTKSLGFELLDQLHFKSPDFIFTPVGNGTLIYSIFKACNELKKVNLIKRIPKIIAVQSSNCAPIYNAWKKN